MRPPSDYKGLPNANPAPRRSPKDAPRCQNGRVWPFRRDRTSAERLLATWFRPVVPEGHASLDAYEAAMTGEERERLPKTLGKLAMDGVERIYQVRRHDLAPDRLGLAYLDDLLGAEMRVKLTQDQDPAHPRNLLRVVATEFGCIVGEIYVRAGKGTWAPQRPPNLWRSKLLLKDGEYDPFLAVVRQLSEDREPGALVRRFDATP